MLLIGNIIGLFWNYLFSLFAYTVAYYLGESFNILYIILSPLVNLIWIVSFWSISLTVLANSKDKKLGLRLDNWNFGNIIPNFNGLNDSLSYPTLYFHVNGTQEPSKT